MADTLRPTLDFIRQRIASYRPRRLDPEGRPPAAVLLPLYEKTGDQHLLFTRRTDLVEHHKGQISFPGGAADPEDRDLAQTALRETHEELGIAPDDVEIFGPLDDWLTVSDFVVTPYVGAITRPAPYPFRRNRLEVEELIVVPLHHLQNDANVVAEWRRFGGQDILTYSFQWGEHLIWGVTARILKHFLDLLEPDAPAERP
jgi:8-oxo-dGTP pyrophosphatase MutT (NUDIX family)